MSTTTTCDDCGACCATQGSPPFMVYPDEFGRSELDRLPEDVRAEYETAMVARSNLGYPDDEPCFWLMGNFQCRHYAHRPEICRKYEVGGEDCRAWRDRFNVEELTEVTNRFRSV